MLKSRLSRMLGVTLLEIMLVLAIAAIIIVMSIRYYSSATASQQVNAVQSLIVSITAAADELSQGSGSYKEATNDNVKSVIGENNYTTPFGSAVTVTPDTADASSYSVLITKMPDRVCKAVKIKLDSSINGGHIGDTKCETGTLSYKYNISS